MAASTCHEDFEFLTPVPGWDSLAIQGERLILSPKPAIPGRAKKGIPVNEQLGCFAQAQSAGARRGGAEPLSPGNMSSQLQKTGNLH